MAERVFLPSGDSNVCIVKRGEATLRMSANEVDKATNIVGIALSMENLDAVPSHITNSPFVVRFFEGDMLALERLDAKGSVPFTFGQGDELITTLQQARAISVNDRTLSKRPGQQ